MKAAARLATTLVNPPLTLADCVVRAARGHMLPNGGVAFSGVLWLRDIPVANFHNHGDGGCNTYALREAPYCAAAFQEFKTLAASIDRESGFEQEDHVIGRLWDVAYTRGVA